MKQTSITSATLALAVGLSFLSSSSAQKMKTPIPPSITTPDTVKTRIGSNDKNMVINPSSSVDVWFGPKAAKGHGKNWVQTVPGKGWNVILRLYGPGQAWFDKTWKPGEFEMVD